MKIICNSFILVNNNSTSLNPSLLLQSMSYEKCVCDKACTYNYTVSQCTETRTYYNIIKLVLETHQRNQSSFVAQGVVSNISIKTFTNTKYIKNNIPSSNFRHHIWQYIDLRSSNPNLENRLVWNCFIQHTRYPALDLLLSIVCSPQVCEEKERGRTRRKSGEIKCLWCCEGMMPNISAAITRWAATRAASPTPTWRPMLSSTRAETWSIRETNTLRSTPPRWSTPTVHGSR